MNAAKIREDCERLRNIIASICPGVIKHLPPIPEVFPEIPPVLPPK